MHNYYTMVIDIHNRVWVGMVGFDDPISEVSALRETLREYANTDLAGPVQRWVCKGEPVFAEPDSYPYMLRGAGHVVHHRSSGIRHDHYLLAEGADPQLVDFVISAYAIAVERPTAGVNYRGETLNELVLIK